MLTPGAILLDRWKILEEIGNGASGKTFLVEDASLPAPNGYVLSQFTTTAGPEQLQGMSERFNLEAVVLERLGADSNGRIPKLHAYFVAGGLFYLVHERIEGKTLTQRLRDDGPMDEPTVRALLAEMLTTLDLAHSRRVVHRNIQPDTILIRATDGVPILTDFGVFGEILRGSGTAGEPRWFQPREQVAGLAVPASDLYSLGLTMICLLTGAHPQETVDPDTGKPEWRQAAPRVGGGLAALLDKAAEPTPAGRWKTAKEMLAALNAPEDTNGPAPVSSPVSEPIPPQVVTVPSSFPSAATFAALSPDADPTPIKVDSLSGPVPIMVSPPEPDADAGFTNGIEMGFVPIPAGGFLMGSNTPESDEKPPHQVTISCPFYMSRYPVTQKQWRAVMNNNPSRFQGENLPVETVSWNDVQEFIKRLNAREHTDAYRLPTEAEWEYACRAGTSGDPEKVDEVAWTFENSGKRPHAVGQKKPNAWGLYDMLGNVWEWCSDWHAADYYRKSPGTDPQGPASGEHRVLRGGSWDFYGLNCRPAFRTGVKPADRYNFIGFRLVCTKKLGS